jgi:hypothetical protein
MSSDVALLSVRVAALRLGIAYSTLKQWIDAGRVRTLAALRLRRGDRAVAIFGPTEVMIGKEWSATEGMRRRERPGG